MRDLMRAGKVGAENVFNVSRPDNNAGLLPHGTATAVTDSYRRLLANHGANNTEPEKLKFMAINR